MKLELTKEETKSLYEGLSHLIYLQTLDPPLDPMVKNEDITNIYKIFQKVRKEIKH